MVGCDIIETERIKGSIDKFGDKFIKRVLGNDEITIYSRKKNKVEFLSGRFAAKEAVTKAFGTGISGELGLSDIKIFPDEKGKPYVYIKDILRQDVEISISHTKSYAMAVCILKEGAKL